MHPEDIKAALRKKGITPASLAEELQVSSATMSQVINGRSVSARVRNRIAKELGKPAALIWTEDKPSMRRLRAFAKGAAA